MVGVWEIRGDWWSEVEIRFRCDMSWPPNCKPRKLLCRKTCIFLSLHSILVRKKFKVQRLMSRRTSRWWAKPWSVRSKITRFGEIVRVKLKEGWCHVTEGQCASGLWREFPFFCCFFHHCKFEFCEIFICTCMNAMTPQVKKCFFCWDVIGWILTWNLHLRGNPIAPWLPTPQRGGWNLSKKKITLTHLVLLRKKWAILGWEPKKWWDRIEV